MVKAQYPICLTNWILSYNLSHAAYKLHNSGHSKQYDCKARLQFSKVNLPMSPPWQLSCKQDHGISKPNME